MGKFSLSFGLQNINGQLREVTIHDSYDVLPSDNIIYVANTTSGAINITLTHGCHKQFLIIKDILGNASEKNINLIGVVDGITNPAISTNRGGLIITGNGSDWSQHA